MLRAGAIYRFPFWERFLFCPTLRQTCCHEDKSAQDTPPHGLTGYEGWDSLIGWQLPPNRMLPGGGGRREREAEEEAGSIQETTTGCQGPGAKSKQHHLLKDPHKVKSERREWLSSHRNVHLEEQALGDCFSFLTWNNPSWDIIYQSDYFWTARMFTFSFLPRCYSTWPYYTSAFLLNWFFLFKSCLGGSSSPLGKTKMLGLTCEPPAYLLSSSFHHLPAQP